jgi:putative pyoverdin transport system ATP-binding/permease protein
MKLIRFVLGYSKRVVALAAVAAVISGLAGTAVLIVLTRALSLGKAAPWTLVWIFAALCVFAPLLRIVSQGLLLRLSQWAVFDMRMELSRQILSAPLRRLEEVGPHRLMASFTDDIGVVGNGAITIPTICMHTAILIGCLSYLAWLSWFMLLVAGCFIVIGTVTFRLVVNRGLRFLRLARDDEDNLFGHFRGLTEGTKELKLHHRRRHDFLNRFLKAAASSNRDHTIAGTTIYIVGASWAQFLHFSLIGLLLFVMPTIANLNTRALTGYTVILIFIMVPLEALMSAVPNLARAGVALDKVESLGLSLAPNGDEEVSVGEPEADPSWQRLDLIGVTHSYYRERENSSFTLGPLDLTLFPGEVVFLVGGNGSGKTTLAKLLAGLYVPERGEIRLDGRPVDDVSRESYRQYFSVVFSDFYLFSHLVGLSSTELDDRARDYLVRLQLEHKVAVKEGALSTIDLSQGQRKRLALLTAYLEDRPIYIFDEWAADQDPHFKQVFYFKLLPELKALGKTVLVISHDDRYYHVADRIIKLEYGRMFDGEVGAASHNALGEMVADLGTARSGQP